MLAAGLEADISVLTGCDNRAMMDDACFHNLAHDLHAVGGRVVGDLSGGPLVEALKGGLDLVKLSAEELEATGLSRSREPQDVLAALPALRARGADVVLVSRAHEPLLVHDGEEMLEVSTPTFTPINHRGAGDSMTGAITAALAASLPIREALRLAVAAGALNVTRHGLGTGDAEAVQALARTVELGPVSGPAHAAAGGPSTTTAPEPR